MFYTDFNPLVPREVAFPSRCNRGQILPSGVTASSRRCRRRGADSLGSGFPAPARASYPFLSPSAHGRRPARGAQTKARAVGPTGPGPLASSSPEAEGPGATLLTERKEAPSPAGPGAPGAAGTRVGRGRGREGRARRARPPAPAPATCPRAVARAPQGPPDGEAHIVPAARPATLTRGRSHTPPAPAGCGARGARVAAGLPRSSTPRSGPALAAPPAATAKLSPHRGGGGVAAARGASVGRSGGRTGGRRVPPSTPPRATDLVRLRFIVVVLGAHGHGHGSWWAQARAR